MPIETQQTRSQQLQDKDRDVSKSVNPSFDPRKMRRVIAEDPEWNLETVHSLTDLCVKHIIKNFHIQPILNELAPLNRQKVLDELPPTVPLQVTGPLIEDEQYWERCCHHRWTLCVPDEYGGNWKRMYFERNIEEMIETFVPQKSDVKELEAVLKLSSMFVKRLRLSQLLPPPQDMVIVDDDEGDRLSELEAQQLSKDHIDLNIPLSTLHCLQELHVTYGVKNCGMNFEWGLFEFTKTDCLQLAKAVKSATHLKVLCVCHSKITDERARLLISYLLDHPGLTTLNLSHNKLGDSSGRALSKLLNGHSVLRVLDVSNNNIGAVGGSSIGHALQNNTTLKLLNLRFNRLGDEGIQPVIKSLMKNCTLEDLNISSNDFTEPSAIVLSEMLQTNKTLKNLNITCNNIGEVGGKHLQEGIEENDVLVSLDLRLTQINAENEYTINQKIRDNTDSHEN